MTFCVWLLSLSIMFSRFIHVAAHISSLLFFYSWIIFHFVAIALFVHPFIHWWTFVVLLLLLPIMDNAAMNIYEHIFAWKYVFNYFGYISRSSFAGSYGNSMFSILRNCQTIFHRGCSILLYQQQCMRVLISPHLCQHLLFSSFLFIIIVLVGVKCYFIVVLICISQIIRDVVHLLMLHR